MRADVHCYNAIAFDVEYRAQVPFNVHRINGSAIVSGESVNFVSAESGVKRILFENFPC